MSENKKPCPFDIPSFYEGDSKDDDSSVRSCENKKPCPFDIPSFYEGDSKDEDSSVRSCEDFGNQSGEDFGNQSEENSRHQQVSDSFVDSYHRLPSAQKSSNQAVAELRLRNQLKASSSNVCSIDAHTNPDAIDEWIHAVEEVHATTRRASAHQNELPNVEELMQPWPREMEDAFNSGEAFLPPADIDLSLEEYAMVLCSLFGIPHNEPVSSVHTLMTLFAEYKEREASNDITLTVEEWG
eukprot:scaffold23816_cov155-Skeletonema_dohrnii-CCMP3373.AAC.1